MKKLITSLTLALALVTPAFADYVSCATYVSFHNNSGNGFPTYAARTFGGFTLTLTQSQIENGFNTTLYDTEVITTSYADKYSWIEAGAFGGIYTYKTLTATNAEGGNTTEYYQINSTFCDQAANCAHKTSHYIIILPHTTTCSYPHSKHLNQPQYCPIYLDEIPYGHWFIKYGWSGCATYSWHSLGSDCSYDGCSGNRSNSSGDARLVEDVAEYESAIGDVEVLEKADGTKYIPGVEKLKLTEADFSDKDKMAKHIEKVIEKLPGGVKLDWRTGIITPVATE